MSPCNALSQNCRSASALQQPLSQRTAAHTHDSSACQALSANCCAKRAAGPGRGSPADPRRFSPARWGCRQPAAGHACSCASAAGLRSPASLHYLCPTRPHRRAAAAPQLQAACSAGLADARLTAAQLFRFACCAAPSDLSLTDAALCPRCQEGCLGMSSMHTEGPSTWYSWASGVNAYQHLGMPAVQVHRYMGCWQGAMQHEIM